MKRNSDLLLDLNILSRSTQKFYDRRLQSLQLSYAQLPVLLMIYEEPGISANRIAEKGQYDKGTVTKNVQKLESLGYISIEANGKDKRAKCLYPTDKAMQAAASIYRIRRDWWQHMIQDIPEDQQQTFMDNTETLVSSAVQAADLDQEEVQFFEMEPLSLSAWPSKTAMVLAVAGCNFRCPDCPVPSRIFLAETAIPKDNSEILKTIQERKGFINGLAITGGEPLMQPGLAGFLRKVKETGTPVRIETNGSFPEILEPILKEGLAQEIVFSIKDTRENFARAAGLKSFDLSKIERSIALTRQYNTKVRFRVPRMYLDREEEILNDWKIGKENHGT